MTKAMPRASRPRELRLGLFGGTFDPIHSGHLAVARAALRRFRLDVVYFIPCGRPPHKDRPGLSPFLHRFAMVALACAGEARFWPSLLEAGRELRGRGRVYSVETILRVRRQFGRRARLYFLLGADASLFLPQWRRFQRLRRLCEFIVSDRPGYPLARVRRRLEGSGARIRFLTGVRKNISATAIRRAARQGRPIRQWVPASVAEYIARARLYHGGQ
jgi:nicotinate-nucleotide adenylyltransferase